MALLSVTRLQSLFTKHTPQPYLALISLHLEPKCDHTHCNFQLASSKLGIFNWGFPKKRISKQEIVYQSS